MSKLVCVKCGNEVIRCDRCGDVIDDGDDIICFRTVNGYKHYCCIVCLNEAVSKMIKCSRAVESDER